jgi:F0F1-type ATP synthase membrane subunit c/vacuolar-type H+-ATPase subunit K
VPIGGSDNPAPQQGSAKMTWTIIVLAFAFSVVMYGLIGFFMVQGRTPNARALAMIRPLTYGLAVFQLLAAVGWLHLKTNGRIGDAPNVVGSSSTTTLIEPGDFQTQTIVALAMAELCSVWGLVLFFLGAPITEFAVFAAGSLLVILLYILPRGLKYWAARENAEKKSGQNSPFSS